MVVAIADPKAARTHRQPVLAANRYPAMALGRRPGAQTGARVQRRRSARRADLTPRAPAPFDSTQEASCRIPAGTVAQTASCQAHCSARAAKRRSFTGAGFVIDGGLIPAWYAEPQRSGIVAVTSRSGCPLRDAASTAWDAGRQQGRDFRGQCLNLLKHRGNPI